MSLRRQQDLLARLYTDAEFRGSFFSDPGTGGAEYGLSAAEIDEIAAVAPDELEFFSETLYWKRRREAEKLLPLVKSALAAEFSDYFNDFAANFQPRTIKKHHEDAVAFCLFLRKSKNLDELTRDVAAYERARLLFFGDGRRIVICRLKYDFRRLPADPAADFPARLPRRNTVAVWLRTGSKIRRFLI